MRILVEPSDYENAREMDIAPAQIPTFCPSELTLALRRASLIQPDEEIVGMQHILRLDGGNEIRITVLREDFSFCTLKSRKPSPRPISTQNPE